jgi:hypothetical protein
VCKHERGTNGVCAFCGYKVDTINYEKLVEGKAECKKDTLKEWIDVFDLNLEDSKRMATLIDIIVKRVRKEEMDKFEQKLEEYRNSDEVWKNVGISKWRNWGEQNGYFDFFNGKLVKEIEGLNPHSQKNPHMTGEYNWYCEGFKQAILEAINLINSSK